MTQYKFVSFGPLSEYASEPGTLRDAVTECREEAEELEPRVRRGLQRRANLREPFEWEAPDGYTYAIREVAGG